VNTKILLTGSAVIVLIFVGFAFYLGLRLRENQISTSVIGGAPANTQLVTSAGVNQQQMENSKQELRSSRIIQQGVVVSYLDQTKELSVLDHQTNELKDLTIGSITEYKCWPEVYINSKGEEISMYGAYFPVKPDSFLYLKGEHKKAVSSLATDLQAGKKIISMVTLTEGDQPTSDVYDLAVLGCTD
jgi:hypothetical protein